MTDGKPPKTGAERAREFRKRQKPEAVDNPPARYENVTEIVTAVTEMRNEMRNERNEIAGLLSEIVTLLRDSSTPDPPLEGVLGVETAVPNDRNENRNGDRNVTRNAEKKVWTNTFTARPSEVPRCAGCKHLVVNCQCEGGHRGAVTETLDRAAADRDWDAIKRCPQCDHNGFIRVNDPTGAVTVRFCPHA